ncbi:MAG: hypothetical protein WC565_06675 [Parcubacteria group bacterium]|jgi:hypothetical protein
MAFIKYAKAAVVTPDISLQGWADLSQEKSLAWGNRTAAKVVFQDFQPTDFLLSHCTIVASVDTEAAPGPLGQQMVDGFQINRRWGDYLITPKTARYVNNNNDAWERKLLLSCFRTFIGGENYVEHIQIPHLSKGKIIDAAARDIGDSIYVDILIATERKHQALIQAVNSGQLQTLSMGCFLAGTQVTMSDGRRLPIEDVSPGDMVLTHKGRAREVLNQQIRVGSWSMRRIEVSGIPSPVVATGTHLFYVVRPASRCACGCGETLSNSVDEASIRRMHKRFKRGHDKRLYNPNGSYSLDEARRRKAIIEDLQTLKVEEVRADELQVGDYVILPRHQAASVEEPGEAKAKLLGYFLAEGSFLKTKGVPSEVQFNFSLDERSTFVADVVALLRQVFPGCHPWVQDREDRTTSAVHVAGKDIAAWFRTYGGEYSHRKRLAPDVLCWSEASQRALLGSWLNGDGTVHSGGAAIGTTTSYDLACQLQVIAVKCGIPVRMECHFGGYSSVVSDAVVNGEVRRHATTGRLASFNLCFPQSSSSILQDVSAKAPLPCTRKKQRHLRSLDDGSVIFPITGIEALAFEGPVFDLEVEEDHSYQVEGLAVHNCSVENTTCTKCGNVAVDETQLCPHIRYLKGTKFVDTLGIERKIAELCGHLSDEPGSVKFIEASWVANPAFKGAVLRSILSPSDLPGIGKKLGIAFAQVPRVFELGSIPKAARTAQQQQFDMTVEPDDSGAAPAKEEGSPFEKEIDEIVNTIRQRAIEKVRGDLEKDQVPTPSVEQLNQNNNLVKEALKHASWRRIAQEVRRLVPDRAVAHRIFLGMILYKKGGWSVVRQAQTLTGKDLLAVSYLLESSAKRVSMAGEKRVYRTVLATGGPGRYGSDTAYLSACSRVVGRGLTDSERKALLSKGRLFSMGNKGRSAP